MADRLNSFSTPTSKALRQVSLQLNRSYRHAAFAGGEVGIRVKDPRFLINLMRRAARELESRGGSDA